jgi:hypothetical protein
MMKMRTKKRPFRAARPKVIHADQAKLRYMRYQIPAKGTRVLHNCHTARGTEGFWKGKTSGFQVEALILGSDWGGVVEVPDWFIEHQLARNALKR